MRLCRDWELAIGKNIAHKVRSYKCGAAARPSHPAVNGVIQTARTQMDTRDQRGLELAGGFFGSVEGLESFPCAGANGPTVTV